MNNVNLFDTEHRINRYRELVKNKWKKERRGGGGGENGARKSHKNNAEFQFKSLRWTDFQN